MAVSSACSVMETTRMPLSRSRDLYMTACSRSAGEPGELPDQNLPEWDRGRFGLVDHPFEVGPVGDTSAFGLVHELADDNAVVLPGVVPERAELRGDGQVHVLPVAGDPCVEGHGRGGVVLLHQLLITLSEVRLQRLDSSSSWLSSDLAAGFP